MPEYFMDNHEINSKRVCKIFFYMTLLCLMCITGLSYLTDPMHFYGFSSKKPIFNDEIMERFSTRWQGYALAKNYPHTVLFLGTSVARYSIQSINDFSNESGLCLPIVGANFKELSILASTSKANRIFWIFDMEHGNAKDKGDFPDAFAQNKWYRHLTYLWQIDVFIQGIKNTLFHSSAHSLPSFYEKKQTCGEKSILPFFYQALKDKQKKDYTDLFLKFEEFVLEFIKKNPEKKITFIFPPSSFYYYLAHYKKNELSAYLKTKKKIIDRMLEFKNVSIYDIESNFEFIDNTSAYYDLRHHDQETYEKILQFLTNQTHKIKAFSKDDIDKFINHIEEKNALQMQPNLNIQTNTNISTGVYR